MCQGKLQISEGNIQKSSALIKYVFQEPQRLDKTNEQIYKNVLMTIMWKYVPIISRNLEKDVNKLKFLPHKSSFTVTNRRGQACRN